MHFPVEGTRKTLLFFTVLTIGIIGLGEAGGDKTLNLKIGFDITQGKNGAPALRIRDFYESEENDRRPRAADEEVSKETKDRKEAGPAIRADSFSDENDDEPSKEDITRSSDNSDESANDSGNNQRRRSTRGLSPGDYEPEEHPNIHERRHHEDDSGSDGNAYRNRYKRHLGIAMTLGKSKSKKVISGRNKE